MTVSKHHNRFVLSDVVHAAMLFDLRQMFLAMRLRQFIEAKGKMYAG